MKKTYIKPEAAKRATMATMASIAAVCTSKKKIC